ncbi:hypothetical protein [Bacillus paranthracis]|uniref:hypothetical protein n=1 Tax=Bacillus paranthracis TaxID=2026186 RepID=UPI002FDC002D|nr:hypothetical protein [Bacillus paranthracis]
MKNLYLVRYIAGNVVLGCTRERVTLKYTENPGWTITRAVLRMWEVFTYQVISFQNKTNSVQA